jgi:putative FmdB family regulatory protein
VPIYAYRCEACGFAKDALQKISDAPLTDCPACGEAKFKKQLTAAGFQLKGTGWYVTDFRNGSNTGKPSTNDATKSEGANAATDTPATVNSVGGSDAASSNVSSNASSTTSSSASSASSSDSSGASSASAA